jgi:hypothetical protein
MEIFVSQGEPPVSTTPVANLPPGINDTGGKFATNVVGRVVTPFWRFSLTTGINDDFIYKFHYFFS